jgi:hypothetical protein
MSPDTFAAITTALHYGVGGLLAIAFLDFVLRFWVPGARVGNDIAKAFKELSALKESGPVLDLDRVREQVMVSITLRHCWDEFRDTLHGQKQVDAMGMLKVTRWRATANSNGFFTEHSLVDAPLRTEFFKHLPGILTGLGIIGTFSGLILGLQGFKVSDDANIVRTSLETLIVSVGGAFIVSGSAIALAMIVTTIEKLMVNKRYTQLEQLCGLIDSLFDAGAGEEYLQRLVEAAETSATQAMQMKESLVTDLKEVLTELTKQQISTMTSTSNQLGASISESLRSGLAEPLEKISNAVQAVGNSQGDAVNKLLTDVLAGFAEKMDGMFGSQLRGMNEMLVQTANTIQTASQRFDQLAGQIQQAGSGAADAMAKRMDEALQQMQARQAEANDQMQIFISQLKDNVAKGQSESAELTLSMMKELSDSTSALVKSLQAQAHGAQEDHVKRQGALADQTSQLLGKQGEQVAGMSEAVAGATAAIREVVQRLETATNSNIERMGLGAERLQGAANRLTDNLDTMKSASDGLGTTADKLITASGTLSTSLAATQQALGEHKAVRDALAQMVADLRTTVENAKREAGMTTELINGLQIASDKLSSVQKDADAYLEGVSRVLAESMGTFDKEMTNTMRSQNKVFHEELSEATRMLRGAIQDLGDVFDSIPSAN